MWRYLVKVPKNLQVSRVSTGLRDATIHQQLTAKPMTAPLLFDEVKFDAPVLPVLTRPRLYCRLTFDTPGLSSPKPALDDMVRPMASGPLVGRTPRHRLLQKPAPHAT